MLLVRLEVAEDSHVVEKQIINRIKFSKPPKVEVSLVEDGFTLVVWENRSSCASARPEVHASWLRTRGPTTMDKYGHASQRPRHCRSQYFSSQVWQCCGGASVVGLGGDPNQRVAHMDAQSSPKAS